jgi:hypothetical protein
MRAFFLKKKAESAAFFYEVVDSVNQSEYDKFVRTTDCRMQSEREGKKNEAKTASRFIKLTAVYWDDRLRLFQ